MILKKLRYKNFFSAGNSFIEIPLSEHPSVVIVGKNGQGKSTLGNAITFALFDKTLKKVSKSLMVNSINGKNCVVELELSESGNEYMIRRGIKPSIFEIYKNGELLDQTSVSDYQQHLEDNILKCSYRTFIQTSIISIEKYTPFMSLSKGDRRSFIEDILDIKVFSVMNTLIKGNITKNKEAIKLAELSLASIKEKIVLQKSHIAEIESLQSGGIARLEEKISELQNTLSENARYLSDVASTEYTLQVRRDELDALNGELQTSIQEKRDCEKELATLIKDTKFFSDNTKCPSCSQDIHPDHVESLHCGSYVKIDELRKTIDILTRKINSMDTVEGRLRDVMREEISHRTKVTNILQSNVVIERSITKLQKEQADILVSGDVGSLKVALKQLAQDGMSKKVELDTIKADQEYQLLMLDMVKDSGIKSKIVDNYVPYLNELVNAYLEKLDFFVSFHLDSEFNETIKSRHRDSFTYDSFSAGEKQRIDISLLFAFRQLCKKRNSFNCNLLLLDELLDSSTDDAGIENMMGIFQSSDFMDTNIFVISHANADKYADNFNVTYNFYKRDGFSQFSVVQ